MSPQSANIVWQNTKVSKENRERLNGHKSCVLWLTGLSGAGKSSLAVELEKEFHRHSFRSFILDGDNIRHGLNRNLSFSPEDRRENIRRIGEVSKLFVDAGLIVITASISPYKADREMVRSIFEQEEFIEIYVKCSIEECERRDPKGLYKKSKAGELPNFTGISAPYEPPENPEIIIETETQTLQESVEQIIRYLCDKKYVPT